MQNGRTFPVSRRAQNGVDARGNPTYTTSSHTIARCGVSPGAGDELIDDGRDGVLIDATLYCDDPNANLSAHDVLTIDGDEFEVDGPPRRWTNPHSGTGRGLVAALRRVEG